MDITSKVEKLLENISPRNFRLAKTSKLSKSVILISCICGLALTLLFSILSGVLSKSIIVFFAVFFGCIIIFGFGLYIWKLIWVKIVSDIVDRNYSKIVELDWTQIYKEFSTNDIKILDLKLNNVFIPTEGLREGKNHFLEEQQIVSKGVSITGILDYVDPENLITKLVDQKSKDINNLQINNSLMLEIKGKKIEILYERISIDKNSKNLYCVIKLYIYNDKVGNFEFNDFKKLLEDKKNFGYEKYDDLEVITFFRLIDSSTGIDDFETYNQPNDLRQLTNSVISIPGSFGNLKIKKENMVEMVSKLIERDCYFIKNFVFLAS